MKPSTLWHRVTGSLAGSLLLAALLAACGSTAPTTPATPDLGVTITNFENGDTVDFSTITVNCIIGSAVTQASYSLNGGEPVDMTFSGSNYDFSVESLVEGKNSLAVTVDDDDPETRGITIIIEIGFGGGRDDDQPLIALASNNMLVAFAADDPNDADSIVVQGVEGTLLGIDYRPANGLLYGFDTTDQLYTIDPETGTATPVSTLSVPFDGGELSGFDFNPMADRLRLTGSNEQNLRVNVDTGDVTQDGTLAYRQDDNNEGKDPAVTASAYRNSVANATKTTLYGIDAELDVLVLQDPPNEGTLATIGRRGLGADFENVAGFDIVTKRSSSRGREHSSDKGYAVSDGRLYEVGLTTGRSKNLGRLPIGSYRGLTAVIAAPERVDDTPRDMVALGNGNTLALFNSGTPNEVERRRLWGVRGTLLGIDYRPATGVLYGLDSSDRIYTIDAERGRATEVRRLDVRFKGGGHSGFDFNPMADRLRLTNLDDQNLRLNVDTNDVVLVDGPLAYATGDANEGKNPVITASAYTNAFAMAPATELYGIDTELDILVEQDPPNDGTLVTDGDLGIDVSAEASFDIVTDDPNDDSSNVAYLLSGTKLYKVDLASGAATAVGTVADGSYRGLAIVP